MFGRRKERRADKAGDSKTDDAGRQGPARERPGDVGELRRLRLRYVGQVQGVGFRWTAQHVARSIGCTGWVRNEWDGSVSMELQGTDQQVSEFFGAFAQEFRRYPIRYTIDEKEDIPADPRETDFSVRY